MGPQKGGRYRKVVVIRRWSLGQVWLYFKYSYIISQSLHAAGEALRVGLQPAELVSAVRQPAVVDVDVGVAGIRVALRRQDVGHLDEVNRNHILNIILLC